MQKIHKSGQMPVETAKWIRKNKTATWNLPTDEKLLLKSQLLNEQNSICCYCGSALSIHGSHIEHIKCQDKYPNLRFDYANLLVSCNGHNAKHCGHKKGNADLPIDPLMDECDSEIKLNLAGELEANHSDDASHSINILNLNDRRLRSLRKSKIDMIRFTFDPNAYDTPISVLDKETLDLILEDLRDTPEYYELKYIVGKIT